jgi:hypothetical protein
MNAIHTASTLGDGDFLAELKQNILRNERESEFNSLLEVAAILFINIQHCYILVYEEGSA